MKSAILLVAVLMLSFVPGGARADVSVAGVTIKFLTDIESWTSAPTTIHPNTAFTINGDEITLTTATDTFVSTLDPVTCIVTIRYNGEITESLSCQAIAGQRVVYAQDASVAAGQIQPIAVGGYAEVGYGNTGVTYRHTLWVRETGPQNPCSSDQTNGNIPSVYYRVGALATCAVCPGQHTDAKVEVQTTGFSQTSEREVSACVQG